MDPEKTAPFELGSGDDACLLLHGFTGSPWDMRPLGERLAERGYAVRAIRLPGHGSTPLAMAQVSHRDWEQAAEEALLSLHHHRHVFLCGLSMGSLLSLLLAARYPERVHGVAALAPALRFRERRMRVIEQLSRWPVLELVKPFVDKTSTDIEDPAIRAQAPILPAFPVALLRDVFHLQRAAREALPLVRSPVFIAMADRDRVVHLEGARELARGLVNAPAVRFIRVSEGAHVMTRDRARELVAAEVGDFFERIRTGH